MSKITNDGLTLSGTVMTFKVLALWLLNNFDMFIAFSKVTFVGYTVLFHSGSLTACKKIDIGLLDSVKPARVEFLCLTV